MFECIFLQLLLISHASLLLEANADSQFQSFPALGGANSPEQPTQSQGIRQSQFGQQFPNQVGQQIQNIPGQTSGQFDALRGL